ncbi:MAG: peptidase M61, partial [Granulosicoccus sp.]|nr:peptidase M61 [Granulosicoccus sp.]
MIQYTVSISDADAHLIDVRLELSAPDAAGQQLSLPNWIPGSYMIRDFSRNIVSIQASCEARPVPLRKLGKSTWQAPAGLASLVVEYRVYAWDLSVRAAHVDRTHAFFNGTSVYLSVKGQENEIHQVKLLRPAHDDEAVFRVATTLQAADTDHAGFGLYQAADYDDLIDHPVELGNFRQLTFAACGVTHDIVFTGDCHFDEQRVIDDLQRICEYQI